MVWGKEQEMPRPEYLRLVQSLPRVRATEAYARVLAQRGGCRGAFPSGVGILVGRTVHLCVVADGRVRGNDG